MDWMPYVWLIVCIICLIVESGTVALVSLWFAGGAFVAMVAAFLGAALWLQGGLFLVVSCLLLAALRPFVRRYLRPRMTKTNLDAIPGREATVIQAIDNGLAQGRVRLDGKEWAARSADGDPLPEGTLVRVERIEGVRLFVTKIKEETLC